MQALCSNLQRFVDLEVVVANDGPSDSIETIEGVRVTRLGTLANVASTPLCPGMFRALAETRADLIHMHIPNPIGTIAYLACGGTKPLIVTYQGDITRQRFLLKAYQPLLLRTLRRCSAVIATSPNYLAGSPVLSAFKERCRVIPMGFSFEELKKRDAGAVADIRRRYGERIVLSVGRLVYYKGFDVLIEAMAGVAGRLIIIGDGPLRPDLESRIKTAGLSGRAVILGAVEDLAAYYHAADVFALASTDKAESFGIVQLEAMACGKPVVNTDIPSGVPFASLNEVTGLTVPPLDPRALAGALTRLLDDPALRWRLGEAGRHRASEEFGVDKMIRETLRLYGEVTGHSLA